MHFLHLNFKNGVVFPKASSMLSWLTAWGASCFERSCADGVGTGERKKGKGERKKGKGKERLIWKSAAVA